MSFLEILNSTCMKVEYASSFVCNGITFCGMVSCLSAVSDSFTEIQAQVAVVLMILIVPQQKLLLSPNRQRLLLNHYQFRRNKQRAVVKMIVVVKMNHLKVTS
jgi:hypothetical protein